MWPLPDNEPLDRLPGCLPFPCGEGNGDSPPLKKPLVAVLRYTLVNGQSLSAGDGGLPNTNSTAELANLPNVFLLNGLDTNGPEGDSLTLDRIQSLKVFAEYDTFQSHASGYYNYLRTTKGFSANDYIYTAAGVGKRSIAELSTPPEVDNIPMITAAVGALLPDPSKPRKGSIHYIQGEKDTTDGTAPQTWKSAVVNLIENTMRKQMRNDVGISDIDVFVTQLGFVA